MNKTISINLGGIFFHIEEAAYSKLDQYLNRIEHHFSGEEGAGEIIEDIESRIAEMLQEMLDKHKRQVVLSGDIGVVTQVMGLPEEFDEPTPIGGTNHNNSSASKARSKKQTAFAFEEEASSPFEERGASKKRKQLFRNPENKIIAGVSSGLSAYFGINDPIWMRLFFAASFFAGYGVLLYPILWVLVPAAKTPAQKLAMQGEDINIANLEKSFKEGISALEEGVEDFGSSETGKKTRFFFKRLGSLLAGLAPIAIFAGKKLFKVFAIICAFALMTVLIVSLLSAVISIFSSAGFLVQFVFHSIVPVIVGAVSIFLAIFIPLLFISYFLVRKSFNLPFKNRYIKKSLGFVWILSLFGIASIGGDTYANEFSTKSRVKKVIEIEQPVSPILNIEALPESFTTTSSNTRLDLPFSGLDQTEFDYKSDRIIFSTVTLDIVKGITDEFVLEQVASAKGGNSDIAKSLAENLDYNIEQTDQALRFSPNFSTAKNNKWRNQKLELTLQVPVGKAVYLAPSSIDVIYDIKNIENELDRRMTGKTWIMTQKGLTLLSDSDPLEKSAVNTSMNVNETDTLVLKTPNSLLNNSPEVPKMAAAPSSPIAPIPPIPPIPPAAPNFSSASKSMSERTYSFSDFEKIEIGGNLKATIRAGESFVIIARGSEEALETLNVDQSSSLLIVTHKNSWFSSKSKDKPEVFITAPELEELSVSGNCSTTLEGFESDYFELSLSGLSQCEATVECDELDTSISGASSLRISGESKILNGEVSGASSLLAYDLETSKAVLEVSGTSSAEIKVENELDAEISGASNLNYKGNPQSYKGETSGVSSITQIEK